MNIYQNIHLTQLLREPIDVKTSSNGNLMYRDLYSLLTKFIWLTIKESLALTDETLSSIVSQLSLCRENPTVATASACCPAFVHGPRTSTAVARYRGSLASTKHRILPTWCIKNLLTSDCPLGAFTWDTNIISLCPFRGVQPHTSFQDLLVTSLPILFLSRPWSSSQTISNCLWIQIWNLASSHPRHSR